MNEDTKFELVPRPPGALEKAEPGTKRILSGMIADTLALVKKEPTTKPILTALLGLDQFGGSSATQPRKARPPRIVILDDLEEARKAHSTMLKLCCEGAEVIAFGDSQEAWQEISRRDPDLFISDINHLGISCEEMLARLAQGRVKYSILVISAVLDQFGEDERRGWGPGLNVAFLSKPYLFDEFRTAVETALQIPARRVP